MGLQVWREILRKEKPCRVAWMNEALQRVGKALAQTAGKPDFQWEFRVFQSDQANAFCLPGGKVGVYSGLFKYLANDAELAAVVGHEIGHALARHGAERVTLGILQDLGQLGLSVALRNRAEVEQVRWMAAYAGLTNVGVILPYSRTQEYAADEIGLMLMAKAGYDPQASLDFWRKFGSGKQEPAVLEFLSTHPLDSHRIDRLQGLLPRAVLEYETAPVRRGYGQRFPTADDRW